METTIQIKLDTGLAESLAQTTARQGTTLDQVISDWARKYLVEERRKIIVEEFESYKRLHGTLKSAYLGQHVAIHEGKLIDHDSDAIKLVARVREHYGRMPILFVQVEESTEPELTIHSTQFAQTNGNF